MKKILLIIVTIILILSVNVLAVDIDVGSIAEDQTGSISSYTLVDKANPANASGVIDQVEIWCNEDMVNCEVATFFVVSGDNLSTRGTHYIGAVTAGAKRTFSGLNITVEEGDYIGIYYTGGKAEIAEEGRVGIWYIASDQIPCTNVLFSPIPGYAVSLYGTGATVGWSHKWNTKEISKWNTKEFTKWNRLE